MASLGVEDAAGEGVVGVTWVVGVKNIVNGVGQEVRGVGVAACFEVKVEEACEGLLFKSGSMTMAKVVDDDERMEKMRSCRIFSLWMRGGGAG